ncbi:MAG TPA: glycine oxidase ThiO [Oscillatoriales cyanobacterium M59_W2019_021]|nr:glycine oxidase ThiO [Oscillatoriales cyanobacterium M4454_W2019_049]HIK51131.1 glycine oxidase ThiO [Oscillatoriales cyanobacterium M59_W2019_021]
MTHEILIIGGGIVGLSLAVELKLRGASVTVVTRDFSEAATLAAAGMLAPQSEGIEPGAMRDLCWRSRDLYPEWTRKLEELSGISADYWSCGFLAPTYSKRDDRSWEETSPAYWLDGDAIRRYQPGLGDEVTGGWWFPEDAQVDNRSLARSLAAAARQLGVTVKEGVTVEGILQQQGRVIGVQTLIGIEKAEHYVLATGAWSNDLLAIPVYPKKGQMISVRAPELPLKRVLFGSETYIVPRRNGRIVIGATSEEVGFRGGNTPQGIQALLDRATRLYPALANAEIEEFWWGFRPATPDELPILGASHCENLTLATGHYRNGILLAPITAALLADWILDRKADPLLAHFAVRRFETSTESPTRTPTSQPMIISAQRPSLPTTSEVLERPLTIAGRTFRSRLMTGSGKYRNFDEMRQSVAACGGEIVTVAVRRVQTNAPGHEGLAEALDWQNLWMLPNTAGCKTAEEAVRVARLGREMAKLLGQEDNNFVKLEVIPDPKYLLPDPIGTLQAAEQLVKEGFAVLPYINADPMLAKRLEDAGCATVMPLGSPIGSGQGIQTAANIQIIIENSSVPVVVDAGIGTPSEAAQAMEMGADAVLINSAIALAKNPAAMAQAMGMAVEAGRLAYLAGRIPIRSAASASSPLTGTVS